MHRPIPRSGAHLANKTAPLRAAATGLLLAAAAFTVAGCGSSPHDYKFPPQPAPSGETPLSGKSTTIGEVAYTAIGLRTQLGEVIGSHGSWVPHGQYVRVRILMVNHGRERHDFDPGRQQIVTTDGKAYGPNNNAMQIARAVSGAQTVASQELCAFDLWFDIPKNASVRALRVFGDASSSKLGDQLKGGKVAGAKNPVDLPLT